MRKALAALLLLLTTFTCAALAQDSSGTEAKRALLFNDMPYHTPPSEVSTLLQGTGFKFEKINARFGDYWYTGTLIGDDARLVLFVSPQKGLIGVLLQLKTGIPDDDFSSLKETLVGKYGQPCKTSLDTLGQTDKWCYKGTSLLLTQWPSLTIEYRSSDSNEESVRRSGKSEL